MAGESGQVVQVSGQDGDRVTISAPLVGFPPGFKLQAGEKVVLVREESGPAVRPLVRPVSLGQQAPSGGADSVSAEGGQFRLAEGAVRDETGKGKYIGFVTEGSQRIIAIRREEK